MSDTNPAILKMPSAFLWGAATAAHQNEGGNSNNQWAAWEAQPGRIFGGGHAGQTTGWWNLESAAADFDRAAELGLNSLRLSVEWSRIEPAPGLFDQTALRHYAAMIGLLRARGLEPMVTLHHFTDPLWLTELGAWENPQVEDYFVRFVTRVVEALGDQVTLWCTINEPFVYAYMGFLDGGFPPGASSLTRMIGVLRRMLLAHGRAYRTIHRLQNNARVGAVHNMQVFLPANPARRTDRLATAATNQIANHSVLAAVTSGRLTPPLGVGQQVSYLMDSTDFIGLNHYSTSRVAFDPRQPGRLFTRQFFDPDVELSDITFNGQPYGEINPHSLYLALKELARYKKPIYITEHGLPDWDDDARPAFTAASLAEAWRAAQEGVDLRGYYHWTLVDNFEWAAGWSLKFGLIDFDPETGIRTPKTSAAVYSRIIQANGVPRSLLEKIVPEAAARYFT
ncbi:MAG: glycoside hydrolase family 1 protein [Chloroflexi bacterium]|nr:glycoside hydrolase family 1 protein [Chloroflexota bacterium]